MQDVEEILLTYKNREYSSYNDWRKSRRRLVKHLVPKLSAFQPDQLKRLYDYFNTIALTQIDIKQHQRVLYKLIVISMISYFRYSRDQINTYFIHIYDIFYSDNELIMKAAIKTLKWIAEDNQIGSHIFNHPLSFVFTCLQSKKSILSALIILNGSKEFIPMKVEDCITRNLEIIFEYGTKVDILKAYSHKIAEFYFNRATKGVEKIYLLCKNAINENIQDGQLNSIIYILRLMFYNYYDFFRTICKEISIILEKYVHRTEETIKFLFEITQLAEIYYKPSDLVELILNDKRFKLFCHLSKTYDNIISKEKVREFIYNNVAACCCRDCVFKLIYFEMKYDKMEFSLEEILRHKPRGKHFLKCAKIKKELITDDIIEYYKDIYDNSTEINQDYINAVYLTNYIKKCYPVNLKLFWESQNEIMKIKFIRALNDNDLLVQIAMFDKSKVIRMNAIKFMKPNPKLSTSKYVLQLLYDSSFKVRKQALKLIKNIAEYNPLFLKPPVTELFYRSIDFVTSLNNNDAPKYASLLPQLISILPEFQDNLLDAFDQLIVVCNSKQFQFERDGQVAMKGNSDSFSAPHSFGRIQMSINTQLSKDSYESSLGTEGSSSYSHQNESGSRTFRRDKPSFIHNNPQINSLTQANNWCNSITMEERDMWLIRAIARIENISTKNLDIVLKTFSNLLATRKKEKFLLRIIKSLLRLTSNSKNDINIRLRCPEIISSLAAILTTTRNVKLGISIIKLLGSAFDYIDAYQTDPPSSLHTMQTDLDNPSFFTDYVLVSLIQEVSERNIEYFTVITKVFEADPENAKSFAPSVIPIFIEAIDSGSDDFRNKLFPIFEIIVASCGQEMNAFLADLEKLLIKYLRLASCLFFAVSLSEVLASTFTPVANSMFLAINDQLFLIDPMENQIWFRSAIMFYSYVVVYQGATFDLYLSIMERFKNPTPFMKEIITRSFVFINNSFDLTLFTSRIHIFANVIGLNPTELLRKQKIIFEHKIGSVLEPFTSPEFYFKDFSYPEEKDVNRWLEDVCRKLNQISPSPAIRACSSYFSLLTKKIYPIAILSCWKIAKEDDRQYFSKIIDKIIHEHQHVDNFFIDIIQLLERSLTPMDVDFLQVARLSDSNQFSFYILQREYLKNPHNKEVIYLLLEKNLMLGKHSSLRALVNQLEPTLDKVTIAKYKGYLGNWDLALKIYKEENILVNTVHCLRQLGRVDDILSYEEQINKLPNKEYQACIDDLIWAYCIKQDTTNAFKYSSTYTEHTNPFRYVIAFYMCVNTELYKKSRFYISQGFKLLNKNVNVFKSGDQNKINQYMSNVQLFVEAKENFRYVVQKKTNYKQITDIWTKRIQKFKHDQLSWERLITSRDQIMPIATNQKHYLKIISQLRKCRHIRLLNSYFIPILNMKDISIVIAKLKVLWMMNRDEEADQVIRDNIDLLYDDRATDLLQDFNIKEAKQLCDDNNQKSRFYRLLGLRYFKDISINNLSKLLKANYYFQISSDLSVQCIKCWKYWGYTNTRLYNSTKKTDFAINGIRCFLNVTKLDQKNSLEYLCQLIFLLFSIGPKIHDEGQLLEDIRHIPAKDIIKVTPQITAQITHPDQGIQTLLINILYTVGKQYFQSIFFPLNLYVNDKDTSKSKVAAKIIYNISQSNREIAADATLFFNGMVNSAITWFEVFVNDLEHASNQQQNGETEKSNKSLQTMFSRIENPKCELDELFLRYFGDIVNECKVLFEIGSPELWMKLRQLYRMLKEKVKQLSIILLAKASPDLANRRGFHINVPGSSSSELIERIEPVMEILSTQQHPRCVHIISNHGNKIKFLLKGNEDLRLDERLMQFFKLINGIMSKNNVINDDHEYLIVLYPIIPLTKNAGLIRWVTGADTLQQLICESRELHGAKPVGEGDLVSELVGNNLTTMDGLQKLELYYNVSKEFPAMELFELNWIRSANSSIWMKRTHRFTLTTALMSIVGYIIGLGDRHPGNIMIQRNTGNVAHIDFGDSFEAAQMREKFPEKVPFRLTRMIVKALEGSMSTGSFKGKCENVMTILRANHTSLIAQLTVFIHEPVTDSVFNKFVQSTDVVNRVIVKLMGLEDGDEPKSVEEQVSSLINVAEDPFNYVRHYPGWCAFW